MFKKTALKHVGGSFCKPFYNKIHAANRERNSAQGNCVAKMHERSNPMKNLKHGKSAANIRIKYSQMAAKQ